MVMFTNQLAVVMISRADGVSEALLMSRLPIDIDDGRTACPPALL